MKTATQQAPEHILTTSLPADPEPILPAGTTGDLTPTYDPITTFPNVQDFNQDPTTTTDPESSR